MYLSPFNKVKPHLRKVYIDNNQISNLLSKLDDIKGIAIKHDETSVVPFVYVIGEEGYINLNKTLKIEPQDITNFTHIGYKRADDLLDTRGKPLHKSWSVAYKLFRLKYPSPLKRIYKFIKFLFTK